MLKSDPPVEVPDGIPPTSAPAEIFEEWLAGFDRLFANAGLAGFALLVDEVEALFPAGWHTT